WPSANLSLRSCIFCSGNEIAPASVSINHPNTTCSVLQSVIFFADSSGSSCSSLSHNNTWWVDASPFVNSRHRSPLASHCTSTIIASSTKNRTSAGSFSPPLPPAAPCIAVGPALPFPRWRSYLYVYRCPYPRRRYPYCVYRRRQQPPPLRTAPRYELQPKVYYQELPYHIPESRHPCWVYWNLAKRALHVHFLRQNRPPWIPHPVTSPALVGPACLRSPRSHFFAAGSPSASAPSSSSHR
ncbi:unnamed protein product, partial [Ectocarpus sp. 13 AM-2016]